MTLQDRAIRAAEGAGITVYWYPTEPRPGRLVICAPYPGGGRGSLCAVVARHFSFVGKGRQDREATAIVEMAKTQGVTLCPRISGWKGHGALWWAPWELTEGEER